MSVTSFEQFHVADLAYPVAEDREVHVSVIFYSDVIFAFSVCEVVLGESPVSATTYKAPSVHIQEQDLVNLFGFHLAYSDIEIHLVGSLAFCVE